MEKAVSKTNQIKPKQIAFVLLAVLMAGKLFYLPGLLYSDAGRDSWISAAVLTVLEWVMIFIIYAVFVRNKDKNLYELLSGSLGGITAKIIMLLLAAFYILHFAVLSAENYNFLTFVTMQKTNWFAFIIPLFAVIAILAFKGANTLARCAELFAPLIFIAAAVLLAGGTASAEIENIMPVGLTGAGGIFSAVLRFSGWFSDGALFLMFLGKGNSRAAETRDRRGGQLTFVITSIVVSLTLVGFFILFPAVFGATAPDQSFALARLSETGTQSFLMRADRAAITVWSFGTFLKMGLFVYAALECVLQAFNIKNGKIKGGILAGMLAAAGSLPVFAGSMDFLTKDILRSAAFSICTAIFSFALPLFLLALPPKNRADKSNAKNTEVMKNVET